MDYHIEAKPSYYKGFKFRSRLEIKWANMFDRAGWQWQYEPFDCDGYQPDFLIVGPRPVLVEVRPVVTEREYKDVLLRVGQRTANHWDGDLLVVGVRSRVALSGFGPDAIGLMREYTIRLPDGFERSGETAAALWHRCERCKKVAFHHSLGHFTGRPCDHYDGGSLLGPLSDREIDSAWAAACNEAQWSPRAA